MNKIFLIKMVFKNLLTHKVRVFLTILGVTIATAAIVFLVSFGFGLENLVVHQISGGNDQLIVDVGITNAGIANLTDQTLSNIAKVPNVEKVEGITSTNGKASLDNHRVDTAVYGLGSDFKDWSGQSVRWGSSSLNGEDKVIVTTGLLQKIGVIGTKNIKNFVGHKVQLTADKTKMSTQPVDFEVVGIIDDDTSPSLYVQKSYFEVGPDLAYTQAKVKVKSQADIANVRKRIEFMGLKTSSVVDTIQQVQQMFNLFKVILASFGVIALVVSFLGTMNMITMSLMERIKEMALLKLLGARGKDIMALIMGETVVIVSGGAILGIIVGILSGRIINNVISSLSQASGGEAVTVFAWPITFLMIVFLITILGGLLTSLVPAFRARRISILETLKSE